MGKVKWVLHTNLTGHELQYANGSPMGKQIPVILLSDLAEVVEGLKWFINSMERFGEWDDGCFYYNQRAAPELQSHIQEAQRLLAQLEEAGS